MAVKIIFRLFKESKLQIICITLSYVIKFWELKTIIMVSLCLRNLDKLEHEPEYSNK